MIGQIPRFVTVDNDPDAPIRVLGESSVRIEPHMMHCRLSATALWTSGPHRAELVIEEEVQSPNLIALRKLANERLAAMCNDVYSRLAAAVSGLAKA
jgi:hypothetical protein